MADGDSLTPLPAMPEDGKFIIVAGPWPCGAVGSRQHKCDLCASFVSLSPRSWEHSRQDRTRRVVCGFCFLQINTASKGMSPDQSMELIEKCISLARRRHGDVR
jgi:hypothetical protein